MKHLVAWMLISMIAACAPDPSPAPTAIELGAPVRERLASVMDTAPPFFQLLSHATVWKDSLAVADMRDASVHLLPRDFEGGRSIGTRGEGPTEFKSPQALAALGDTLVVFDRGNARVVWVGPDGRVGDSRPLQIPGIEPGFVALESRGILHASADPALYAEASTEGEPVDPIHREGESSSTQPASLVTLVPHETGPVVIDTENAEIVFAGVDPAVRTSPPQDLLERLEARIAEFPPEFVPALIIQAGEAPQGVVVWFPFETGTVGALVSPDGQWQLLTSQVPIDYPLGLLVWDDDLIHVGRDGIRAYALQLPPSRGISN